MTIERKAGSQSLSERLGLNAEQLAHRRQLLGLADPDHQRVQDLHTRLRDRAGRMAEQAWSDFLQRSEAHPRHHEALELEKFKQLQIDRFCRVITGQEAGEEPESRLRASAWKEALGLPATWSLGAYANSLRALGQLCLEAHPQQPAEAIETFSSLIKLILLEISLEVDTHQYRFNLEQTDTYAFLNSVLEGSTEYSIVAKDLDGTILAWNEGARRTAAHVTITLRRDPAGNPVGFTMISRDLTESQRIEQELRESQEYNRGLIESNIDALMTTDPLGVISDVNRQMCSLTGYGREELIGTPIKRYFTDPKRAEDGIRKVLTEDKVTNYELTIRSRDGRETVVSYNATTFRSADGKLKGVFAAARDITEQKRLEEGDPGRRVRHQLRPGPALPGRPGDAGLFQRLGVQGHGGERGGHLCRRPRHHGAKEPAAGTLGAAGL